MHAGLPPYGPKKLHEFARTNNSLSLRYERLFRARLHTPFLLILHIHSDDAATRQWHIALADTDKHVIAAGALLRIRADLG